MVKNNNLLKDSVRHCPICGCISAEIMHMHDFLLTENHPLPKHYDVVCCCQCGFVFADTPAPQDTYNFFYTKWSKYEDEKTSSGTGYSFYDKVRLEETADTIMNLFPDKNIFILDMGCGNGGLLKELKLRGYKRIMGCDPSFSCVQNVLNQNIESFQGTLFDESNISRKFDLVILSHVLEHVCDLQNAKQILLSLLNEGGKIYIETPDASRYVDFYVTPFHYFDVEHINHFDARYQDLLFATSGMECISTGTKQMAVSQDKYYPAVYSVLQKCKRENVAFEYNDSLRKKIMSYIELSESNEDISDKIQSLYNSNKEIIVWGVGSYTMSLLSSTDLACCNIKCFIDSNPLKQGTSLLGKEIKDISALIDFKGVVVICSALYASEIVAQIKDYGCTNELVILK